MWIFYLLFVTLRLPVVLLRESFLQHSITDDTIHSILPYPGLFLIQVVFCLTTFSLINIPKF